MAFAVTGGHVSRALDFLKAPNKYFIIGGTEEWGGAQDVPPESADVDAFRLRDVVGLRRVTRAEIVVKASPTDTNIISYRNQNWKIIPTTDPAHPAYYKSAVFAEISQGSYKIKLTEVTGLTKGSRVRIGNIYEGIITSDTPIAHQEITLDTPAPAKISVDTPVYSGALVERATHVYVECSLDYDYFPVYKDNKQTEDSEGDKYLYRQVGLCTNLPYSESTVVAPGYKYTPRDGDSVKVLTEAELGGDLGILEILDNRVPSARSKEQKENLSLIIEF